MSNKEAYAKTFYVDEKKKVNFIYVYETSSAKVNGRKKKEISFIQKEGEEPQIFRCATQKEAQRQARTINELVRYIRGDEIAELLQEMDKLRKEHDATRF